MLTTVPSTPAWSHRSDNTSLDRRGALVLDQLLADRPGKRLEGFGASSRPQPRTAANRRADQGIAGELALESTQILIDTERKAHPLDSMTGRLGALRTRPEQDRVGRGLSYSHMHRHPVAMEQPFNHTRAIAQDTVHAAEARQTKRPGRRDLYPQLHRVAFRTRRPSCSPRPTVQTTQRPLSGAPSRCTSTSRERDPTIAISPDCLERLPARPSLQRGRGRDSARLPGDRDDGARGRERQRPPESSRRLRPRFARERFARRPRNGTPRRRTCSWRATPAQARAPRREPPRQAARSHQAV